MGSTFYGLEIGRTGLNVSQQGLNITGHNIANVETLGYTRQRLVTTSIEPYSATMKFKSVEIGIGGGATVTNIEQIRSKFLDRQYRTESANYAYWSTRTTGLTYVQALFEGSDDATLSQGILDLFGAFNTLTTEANDQSQRTVIWQAGISLCDSFNQIYERLIEQQESQNLSVETVVNRINTIADNIAVLNKSIYYYEMDGQNANDLRDKRNLLLDELSTLVNIEYQETNDNKLIVKIDGVDLVNYTSTTKLGYVSDTEPISGKDYSYPCWLDQNGDPVTDADGDVLTISASALGGELGAHMDLRDNATSKTPGIAYFIDQLNTMARALVETINSVHSGGYTHAAGPNGSVTGVNFFDVPEDSDGDADLSLVTAGNLSLSAEILASVYNIAASDCPVVLAEPNDNNLLQEGNQKNAIAIYELLNKTDITLSDGSSIGSLYGYMSGIVLDVATTLEQCKKYEGNYSTQLLSVDTQRASVSGVSLNEEMTNLIKYQHAYQGASRVITAMDDALETLINKMGRVGL